MKDYRVTWLHGHKFTTWTDLRRLWSRDYVHVIQIDHPDGTRTYPGMTDARVRRIAREIANSIISDARNSGPDPIAWITGNSMMPPLRSFDAAEDVWQHAANDDGEAFAWLTELIEGHLSDANVALECPEYDNALYAVDLARFEFVPQSAPDGDEYLQDEWSPIETCAVCGSPLSRTDISGRDDEYVHADDDHEDHVPARR